MGAIPKLDINEVFGGYLFAQGGDGYYRVPEGWYPVLGLSGSLDIEEHAVLFCTLRGPIEAAAQKACLNGVIAKIRIHRSARVNGPDTMLVLASDLVHEFELCRVPRIADANELARCLSGAPPTQVPPEKREAYRTTRYGFGSGPDAISLRIDLRSDALARLYAASGVDCGVFISACNPHGLAQDDAANAAAHARLGAELAAGAGTLFEGAGVGAAGDWPAEPSWFALGVDLESARALGARLRQDAIVWAGPDAVPRLVLLR